MRLPPRSPLFPYTTLFRSSPCAAPRGGSRCAPGPGRAGSRRRSSPAVRARRRTAGDERRRERSEEHTSELQSRQYLVCRLLLEKKKLTIAEGVRQVGTGLA